MNLSSVKVDNQTQIAMQVHTSQNRTIGIHDAEMHIHLQSWHWNVSDRVALLRLSICKAKGDVIALRSAL